MSIRSKKIKTGKGSRDSSVDIASYATPAKAYNISHKSFHPNAINIISRLEDNGFQGFIVGGAVRDLLCEIKPKDFDIATDATPEQVHKLFSNSRLIGRRFKIVHIFFGREIFEIATFRGDHSSEKNKPNKQDKEKKLQKNTSHISHSGQLLRDNVYGNIKEDALRRDFSSNALYYSPTSNCIYDFCDALKDINNKQLRLIGNPELRYAEDPVRMLRAIRFSNKLQFPIEKQAFQQIQKSAPLIKNISNARLFDESIKLFHSINALGICQDLTQHGLFQEIYPLFSEHLDRSPWANNMLELALKNTCQRIQQGKPVTIAYLYAVILWPAFLARVDIKSGKRIDIPKLGVQALELIREQSKITSIPKRHAYAIKDIWELQVRLEARQANKIEWILQHRKFRAGFDFLLLREACQEISNANTPENKSLTLGQWWERIQFANETEQQTMIQNLRNNMPKKKSTHKKPRNKKPQNKPNSKNT